MSYIDIALFIFFAPIAVIIVVSITYCWFSTIKFIFEIICAVFERIGSYVSRLLEKEK
jgi:hypothetical protein